MKATSKNKIFYHGTPFTFEQFSNKNKGVNTNHSPKDVAFHFTDNKDIALTYSRLFELESAELSKLLFGKYPKGFVKFEPQIVHVKLEITNPMIYNGAINEAVINKAKNGGYDGIINPKYANEHVVFKLTQIKIIKIEKVFKMSKVKQEYKRLNS